MNSDLILIRRYMQGHSQMAARTLEVIDTENLAGFFTDSPNEWLLKVIPHMDPHRMSEVFEKMKPEKLVSLIESMDLAHAVLSIRMMNQDLANNVLSKISKEKSVSVNQLLHYLDHTVGAYMDTKVFTLGENLTVKEAMANIKKHKGLIQPQLFVLGAERKLLGIISLSELIRGEPGANIKSMMVTNLTALSPETPVESVLSRPEWENFYALPVADPASIFLGAIRLETIRSKLTRSVSKEEEMGQMTIAALGELYRLGLAGLLKSATDIQSPTRE
jgi:magnesium transporter